MTESTAPKRRGIFAAIGPAIITASVVLGPGSILSNSNVGATYGYSMIWLLLFACLMMVTMTAISARLGVCLSGTICDEVTARVGRWMAFLAGASLFLIATCFQFGNNLGVTAAVDEFLPQTTFFGTQFGYPDLLLVVLNVVIIAALYGFKHLYVPVEKLMMILVGMMLIGFAGNLILAKPSVTEVAAGLIPSLPEMDYAKLGPLIAMVATTLSIGGAFYQSYLVRQKGWNKEDLQQGFVDSAVGISVLGVISAMIMITAGSVLYKAGEPVQLANAADVARQLEPLFGTSAKVLFCMGLFAGAFSSFLVNAVIAGSMLADGVGLGGNMDDPWPKRFTVFALLMGMGVAIWVRTSGQSPVPLIIFAQSITVLGNPLLAGLLLWLATRSDMKAKKAVPSWLVGLGGVAFALVLVFAGRTAFNLYQQFTATG